MAWWTHRTKTGRIVYDRRRHGFNWRDVLRIVFRIPTPDWDTIDMRFWLLVLLDQAERLLRDGRGPLQALEQLIEWLRDEVDLQPPPEDPRYGGAGATRDIPESDGSTRAPGESPFALGPCGVPWFLMPFQTCGLEIEDVE